MEQAGEGTGGGGATSIITSLGTQSPAPSTPGNASSSANPPPVPAPTSANPPPASEGSASNDWRLGLPKELQDDASIKKFNDIHSLAGAYVNLQKLVGKEKLTVPDKHASEEDWKNLYHKIGLPQDLKDYSITAPEGVAIDPEFINKFKEQSHAFGVLPNQAQKMLNWFGEVNKTAEASAKEMFKANQDKAIQGLQSEWGEAFQTKISRAYKVSEKFGGKDFIDFLDKTGLGNDVKMIKFLAGLGEEMSKEGTIVDAQSGVHAPLTPADAKAEIDKIMGDKGHPYFDKTHPGNKAAIEEVNRLFQLMVAKK